jgi:hypothetical protein
VVVVLRIQEVSFFHQHQHTRSRGHFGNREGPAVWYEIWQTTILYIAVFACQSDKVSSAVNAFTCDSCAGMTGMAKQQRTSRLQTGSKVDSRI